ncbi:calpain-8-like [Artemia franciscana]|uniref:Calpain catalytic domain-containing protein n=1 Tax=Artemia franciscana TaxID=6661 RepID=A0AA88HRH0_ARTSF|nr:hypothetical protein QYM36_008799 [Artemia franciscana]
MVWVKNKTKSAPESEQAVVAIGEDLQKKAAQSEDQLKTTGLNHWIRLRDDWIFWKDDTNQNMTKLISDQHFYKIKKDLLAKGKLFEDTSFPLEQAMGNLGNFKNQRITWRRPHEICSDGMKPQFLVGDSTRLNVKGLQRGRYWLVAAMISLALNPVQLKKIAPEDQSFDYGEYAGIFRIRLWQYGQWQNVIFDDRVPTLLNSDEITYAHSQKKEVFWSVLLEKAYAKLHWSYDALNGGNESEAMEDFTGGLTIIHDPKAHRKLFKIADTSFKRSCLMTCNIKSAQDGSGDQTKFNLYRHHAYSITNFSRIASNTIPVVRIRNPGGTTRSGMELIVTIHQNGKI